MTNTTTQAPVIVPEPNFHRWTGGYCAFRRRAGRSVDQGAKDVFPGLADGLTDLFGSRSDTAVSPDIVVDVLYAETYREARAEFEADLPVGEPPAEAYSLRVHADHVRIAARSKEGFLNALNRLRLLRLMGLPNCTILDSPSFPIRAVRIIPSRVPDLEGMKCIAQATSALGYNLLTVVTDDCGGVSARARASRERLGGVFPRQIQWDAELPPRMIPDLDGPAQLDWEYATATGIQGACIDYRGEFCVDAMAASGFLYNLAYSATMLWHRDYNNFSWEKVAESTASFLPLLVSLLGGRTTAEDKGSTVDSFPITHRSVTVGPPSSTVLTAQAGVHADSLLFSHAILPPAFGRGTAIVGGTVGRYVIRYRNRRQAIIPLVENRNIGRRDIWPGRRYDPLASGFQTDPRLRSLSCFTRPRGFMGAGGRREMVFDYEWINPHPKEPIERVVFDAAGATGRQSIAVDQVVLTKRTTVPGRE